MKKINENTKVTLTLKQLKRLVKESDDSIDFKFINSTLDQIVKTVSDCKMALQDLYRDARYGKTPATMGRRQQVIQAMSEIRNLAHDISQEVK